MRRLILLSLAIATLFASTFLVVKFSGVLTVEDIKSGFMGISEMPSGWLSLAVIGLLFLDMFIAIPTLTIITMSGYFLGPVVGGVSSIAGLYLAGLSGYSISRCAGNRLLEKIYGDPSSLAKMQQIFIERGALLLVLCRAMPILPEVSCCLAGLHSMPLKRFLIFYSLGSIPYVAVAVYAGSQSTMDNPLPGIVGAVILSGSLWLAWSLLLSRKVLTKRYHRCFGR